MGTKTIKIYLTRSIKIDSSPSKNYLIGRHQIPADLVEQITNHESLPVIYLKTGADIDKRLLKSDNTGSRYLRIWYYSINPQKRTYLLLPAELVKKIELIETVTTILEPQFW